MRKAIHLTLACSLGCLTIFGQKIINNNNNTLQQKTVIPARERMRQAIVYNFSNVRMCIDQVRNSNLPPKTQNPIFNLPAIRKDGKLESPSSLKQGLTAQTDLMWPAGEVITVGFFKNETTQDIMNKVKQYAKFWEHSANISFAFIDDVRMAHIKVGFMTGGSWSWIGRDVLDNPTGQRTMNFGWLSDSLKEEYFRSVVFHEFGHALGFLHEHQSPVAGISWDKDKVYAYFGQAPNNWSKETVDRNVFQKYSATATNYSDYDKNSIMHYYFPAELTTNNTAFYENKYFSPVDLRFAKIFYPPVAAPSGTLKTGDDCDEIDFTVEYNAVPNHMVEFILEPGIDNKGNRVTWWKQISIPMKGGVQINFEMQDGRSDRKTLPIIMIDKTRAIAFAKAKILGVHTGLGFTWDVLPAIIGGCRVKLTWRNDHCQ